MELIPSQLELAFGGSNIERRPDELCATTPKKGPFVYTDRLGTCWVTKDKGAFVVVQCTHGFNNRRNTVFMRPVAKTIGS